MWPYPKIIAHRGGGKLAPENTLAALQCALDHGFSAVEFDVMLAQDGVPVVLHDPQLGRTVQGLGNVSAIASGTLALMDAGSWFDSRFARERVPLLTQFIAFCREHQIWMNVEIKPAPGLEAQTGRVVAALVRSCCDDLIAAGDTARVPLLSSFSIVALLEAQQVAPDLARAWLVDRIPRNWQAQARALDIAALHVNARYVTLELVCSVHQAGYGLFCYTVNDALRARQLLDWGVDAFCTDRIDLIGPQFAEFATSARFDRANGRRIR
jgi:glycerophosphoryl diester phosphodiesterase